MFATDWHALEDLLNEISAGAGDPLYSRAEAAKASLFRICDRALMLAEGVRAAALRTRDPIDQNYIAITRDDWETLVARAKPVET